MTTGVVAFSGRKKRTMKIWLVNQYAAPPSLGGGTRHYSLARELIRKGHEMTIIASSFNHSTRRETRLGQGEVWKYEVIDRVPFLWLRTPPYSGNSMARIWNMLVFAGRVWSSTGAGQLNRPDIIIGSITHLFGALAAELLARRRGIHFVLEVRDLWPQTLVEMGNVSPHHPMVRVMEWIERYLYRRAELIVSLLPTAVEHMVEKGAERSKVVWIPNGIDLNLVPPLKPPDENNILTVMYAGAHGIANGLDSLLNAASILQREGWLDRVRFRFIGDGSEKARLRQRVQNEGILNVYFDEPVPKEYIYSILQEADIFLVTLKNLALYRWGMSLNKLFDYMSSARPIVFGANLSLNPVAEAQAGLTVPPEDAHAIAEAIKQLAVMSPAERWQMGLRGRRFVEEHHDFRRLAERLEVVLNGVVRKYDVFAET